MRINRLEMTAFRNHEHTTIEFGDAKFCVFRGANFAGKSSIAQAISMLMTPSTDGLNAKGDGYIVKVKRGSTKAIISGDIQGKSKLVQRTVVLNSNTSGRTDSSKCLNDVEWHPAPFDKLLAANRSSLSVALNTSAFLQLDEKAQKDLLAKLALPSSYDFDAETMGAVEKAIGAGEIDFTGEPFAVIDLAYKKLYAERQLVNRQVKEFKVPDALPTGGVDSASLQAKLSAARDARQRILTEKDGAVKKSSDHENERTRVQTKLNGIETAIAEEKAKLPNVEAGILPESKHKELVKIAAGKEAADKYTKDRAVIAVTITTLKDEVERINGLLDKFSDAGAKCPTCEQEVDMRVLEALQKAVQDELTEAQEKDTTILRSMKTIGDVDGAVAAIAKHDAAKADMRSINQVIAEKEKMAQVGKEKLASMGAKVDAAAQFEEPLIAADNEINALTEQLRPVIAAEERTKEIATKTAQLEKLKAKAESVDSLVKIFDKDGLKADLLKENIGGFEEKLNSVLSAWGYKCALSIEPYEFLVTDTHGVTTPVRELSGSEQLMFSVALQCAVSRASGIGIVVADRMDTFLPPQRAKANRCLYTATQDGTLDQVIVLVSDESEDVPKLPNAAFYKVDNGTVYRLGEV